MSPVFADSFYFLALLNPSDQAHEAALRIAATPPGPLLTTAWIVTEVADALAAPAIDRRSSA